MPIIRNSSYKKAPFFQFNGHLQTIIPGIFRKVKNVNYQRERLELEDQDFLDLDWINNESQSLVLLSHGLEGNSDRQYIKGAAKLFSRNGWDVLAWNCRSCSGEMNRSIISSWGH
jgi:predicted alpha/beta-fold hydrolase